MLAFAIAEEGTSLLTDEPFGSGKSSLSAGFEVRRKYFKIDDIFNMHGWSRAWLHINLFCLPNLVNDNGSPNSPMFSSAKISRYTVFYNILRKYDNDLCT